MSVVLCCNVAFHLPAVCSLSVTKSCSMRKHHIYWADNPSVLKGLSSCHNRAALLLFHQFRFTNVCCRNNPGGGKDSTKKKDVKKKLCLVSSEPKVLVQSMKVVKSKLLRHLCDLKGNWMFHTASFVIFCYFSDVLDCDSFYLSKWTYVKHVEQKTFFVHSCWQKLSLYILYTFKDIFFEEWHISTY